MDVNFGVRNRTARINSTVLYYSL